MITVPAGAQIWIAAGITDLRRGFDGLSALVQMKLEQDPFGGHVFVFRGRRGDLIKVLWWDPDTPAPSPPGRIRPSSRYAPRQARFGQFKLLIPMAGRRNAGL